MSPTQCSLNEARRRGWAIYDCQCWKPAGRLWNRSDVFGFVDHFAFGDGLLWAIQSTSKSNRSARIKKIMQSEWALYWLAFPQNRIAVWDWGWYDIPVNGEYWRLHEEHIGLVEIEDYRDQQENL